MSTPREAVRAKAREWAAFAEEDLRLARHALSMERDCPYRLVAYHAQQCVEKYLKSYLVLREVDFPRTHNISLLLELCAESSVWAEALAEAERLTVYGVITRYPGGDRPVTKEEAVQAIRLAEQVTAVVRDVLQENGLSGW